MIGMRLVAESGLWSAGPAMTASPLVAVLEVSGAVLSWTIDAPADLAEGAAQITFTDVARADWLWRVVGEAGHVALARAAAAASGEPSGIEVPGIDIVPGSVDPLRRLAVGHWLRRWWPASRRDGIPSLDRALLDVEVALLTSGAQGFFTDDTLDSDVTQLLAPHAATLLSHLQADDARVRSLVRASADLADETGVDDGEWPELYAALENSTSISDLKVGRQDDYALAAGGDAGSRGAAAIGRGVASIDWSAVPPGIFDAAEDTVDWSVKPAGPAVVAIVRAALIGPDPATGISVRVRSGAVSGDGALDADGSATLPLVDAQQRPMPESSAWDHDWPATTVTVGAPLSEASEPRDVRDRVRRWARSRLERPAGRGADKAFLAEVLAGESAY
jgi:hypothetical protein